jgi:RNA-directed DNA polymerase
VKRVGNLWPSITEFTTLRAGALRAARGKRDTAAVAPFLDRLEPAVLALQRRLRDGSWRPGPVQTFVIHDPKLRTITVTPFADQVVHHALMLVLEPVLERRMIAHSYACRVGKGTHRALRTAQTFVQRHGWFLKLDVQSFFDSLPHATVRSTLARVVKDPHVLGLCDLLLRGPPGTPARERGLPIGTLTSQWFANLVLDRLDHEVTEHLRVPGYVRYMDDFVLFADDRDRLRDALHHVTGWLRDTLGLAVKERATILAPADQGLPFLGWQVFRSLLRLRPENLRRYRWRLRLRRWELARGRRSAASYRACVAGMAALLEHGNTRRLRQGWWPAAIDDPAPSR